MENINEKEIKEIKNINLYKELVQAFIVEESLCNGCEKMPEHRNTISSCDDCTYENGKKIIKLLDEYKNQKSILELVKMSNEQLRIENDVLYAKNKSIDSFRQLLKHERETWNMEEQQLHATIERMSTKLEEEIRERTLAKEQIRKLLKEIEQLKIENQLLTNHINELKGI